MTPRASFVIPAYNAEQWISKAIYSARNQTIKQIEIVVVNDGSTDATKEIIEWHAKEDKRVVLLDMGGNKGRSAARNAGNAASRSDLILVLDSDDMACRNRVKDTLAIFQLKNPDFVYGSFYIVDSFGNAQKKIVANPFDPEQSKRDKFNYICHSTVAYKTSLTKKVRYEEGDFSKLGLDDWKFQWDAYKAGAVIKHLKTPLSYYRIIGGTISSTRDENEVKRVKEEYLASV